MPPCSQHCAGCGGRHSQLARGSTPRQAGLARFCRSQNLSSASGLAIGVATPPTVRCQSYCCVRLLLAQQRAPQNTYSRQHSLLARGSIPRQVESNTKGTALCTARISICAVCALATGPLRRLGECKAHSTLLCPRSSRRRTLCPTHPGKLLRPYSSKGSLCARDRDPRSPPPHTHSHTERHTYSTVVGGGCPDLRSSLCCSCLS